MHSVNKMWNKFKDDAYTKEILKKVIIVILITSIGLLTVDVMTTSKDGRRQIVDPDGASEYTESKESSIVTEEEARLTAILSNIDGVGDVKVMITSQENRLNEGDVSVNILDKPIEKTKIKVEGVIVTAEGAGSVTVKNDIISGVTALYGIPSTRVMVYEKKGGTDK